MQYDFAILGMEESAMPVQPLSHEEQISRRKLRQEDVRGPFFRDQTAILHSTPFRRLKKKTQVFFAPENDHICTRMEHVLHVATIAVTISRGLSDAGWDMDTDLAYAAGMGHDLGHTPFGHSGERMLNAFLSGGFRHEAHSLKVVDSLAHGGEGLNLTRAVRDAIVCHNGERLERTLKPEVSPLLPEEKLTAEFYPATWEGCAVRMADRIAYLGRDMEDAMTAGILKPTDLPKELRAHAESINSYLIDYFVEDLVSNSPKESCLALTEEAFHNFNTWYGFNVDRIYRHPMLLEYERRTTRILEMLLDALCVRGETYLDDPERARTDAAGADLLYQDFAQFYLELSGLYGKKDAARLTADYVAGMTDQFALEQVRRLLWPQPIA